jgi:hypothetical protein
MEHLGPSLTIVALVGTAVFNILLVLPLVPLALRRPAVA